MDIKPSPRKRGRPREFDQDQALDRAVSVFWERGYEGASMDDLTAAMGLSRPSVYAAFGDKRGLFLAAIERYRATLGRRPLDAFLAEADPARSAQALLEATLALAFKDDCPRGCLIACVANDAAFGEPQAQRLVRDAIRQTEAAIADHLGIQLETTADRARHVAQLLVSTMQGLAIRSRAGMPHDDLKVSLGGLVAAATIILDALRQPSGKRSQLPA